MNCSNVRQKVGYQKGTIPRPVQRRPLELGLEIQVIDVPSIDTFGLRFEVDFSLGLVWNDQRLVFQNLRNKDYMNKIDIDILK